MGKNSVKDFRDNVIELGGSEFRRVKNGLDEDQVASFMNELIGQRDALMKREEHLSSLTKLAEKTVTEADRLAEEIKEEATEQAKAETAVLMAKAEEQTQQMIEEKRTEIISIANEEAAAVKAEAERRAETLLENQRKKIQPELINFVHQLSSQLVSELDNFKNQVVALEVELEHKLSQPAEEASIVTMEAEEIPDEFLGLIRTSDKTNTGEPKEKVSVLADDMDTTTYEGEPEWELEILPPMDIMKVMGVVTHLDSLPEVEKTEIIPRNDKPSIVVFLREPLQLIEVIKTLPEVAHIKEDATDVSGTNGKPKKVQIELSEKTVPKEDG